MKVLLKARYFVVAFALVATLCLTSMAAPTRPFKLKGEAQIQGDPFTVAPFSASGNATHLGAWTGGGLVLFIPTEDGDLIAYGYLVCVAANGDQLFSWFLAIEEAGSSVLEGVHYFDGGTGRFLNATGEAAVVGEPAPGNVIKLNMNGSINY